MPANAPLSIVIPQILQHTPRGVWIALLVITLVGLYQTRDQIVSSARLTLMPLALGAFSLWGTASAFGMHRTIVVAWLAGIALAFAANRVLQWPRQVRVLGNGSFALQGSVWPLALMLTIFALRYGVAVTLALHPQARADVSFGLTMALVYGSLSGLFAARAVRILRSAAAQPTLSVA